ncbi:M20 family metallopeptidase [Candidatus Uabimicrobium sp. HlEnr_7]|uniref:M20 metallopeptidase family protein n=1 Tax=Candidatus Uabimicrobium helgolandensis TaxID=3095367 RepID=UPI003557B6CE
MTNLISADLLDEIIEFRRDLHKHPELSWQEKRTCAKICEKLQSWGISHRVVAGTGIIAEINPGLTNEFLAFRADIDALPVCEETGLEFSSVNSGVMHACGHDGHTSMLLGTIKTLALQNLPYSLRFLFQPGEEHGNGASRMIEEGALENVAAIFGGHVDRHYTPGEIIISSGAVNASTDQFHITINGQGGHGARPHESIDTVVIGSLIVMALQTIVSREVDPAKPSVISVGVFSAGTASNVIAGTAKLEGTIRALDNDVRYYLRESIKRIALSVGGLHGANVEVNFIDGTPPLINEKNMADLSQEAARTVVENEQIKGLYTANMGGEDFSYYLEHVPGSYVRFGSQIKGRENFPAHSSKFDIDESVLAIGAAYFSAVARIAGQKFLE